MSTVNKTHVSSNFCSGKIVVQQINLKNASEHSTNKMLFYDDTSGNITCGNLSTSGIPAAGSLTWTYRNTISSTGEFKASSVNLSSVSSINVTIEESNGIDVSSWLQTWGSNTIQITKRTDSTIFGIYSCSSVVNNVTYYTINLTLTVSNGSFVDGENYVISSIPNGPTGPSGSAGNPSGNQYELQYNTGSAFGGNSGLVVDYTNPANNKIGINSNISTVTSSNYDLSVGTEPIFAVSKNSTNVKLTSEPDLSGFTTAPPVNNTNVIKLGVVQHCQVSSNITKGIAPLWPIGVNPSELQVYRYHGHDYGRYSSFNPVEDSILNTAKENKGQPFATMDLGMSSRIPAGNGIQGYGFGQSPGGGWNNEGGSPTDNYFIKDPYIDSGNYPNWDGQLLLKTGIPGIYILERRWDRVIANQNYTASVNLRSNFRPTVNPNGDSVSGVDFYDLELSKLHSETDTTDWRISSRMDFNLSRLDVNRASMTASNLLTITTNKTTNLSGTGVNYTNINKWGGASMIFQKYDGAGSTGLLTPQYTALIDGLSGEIKALSNVIVGSSTVGTTPTTEIGQSSIILKPAAGTESLVLKGIDPSSGPSPYKCIDMKTGLAYYENSFAVLNGANSDHVGVVSIKSSNTNVRSVDLLQVNSSFDLVTNYPPTGTYGSNIIACKNNNSTVSDNLLFTVDVAGKLTSQTDKDITTATFVNTRNGTQAQSYTSSIIEAKSSSKGAFAPYSFTGTATGGFSFMKCILPDIVGGYNSTRCQIDGDGSIKNMVSITVSDSNSEWPPTGDSRNITLLPGPDSLVTTRYSSASSGTNLCLQADGPYISSTYVYDNMVKCIPNNGENVCGFMLENKSSPDSNTENMFWWSRDSDVSSNGSLYMVSYPGITGATRSIFEFRGGGSIAGKIPNIIRYYPEGLSSSGAGNNYLILGDDRSTVSIQMGGGKVGNAGSTVPTQGKISVNVVDCNTVDTTTITAGSSSNTLNIGNSYTDKVNISLGGNTGNSNGSIEFGTAGYIRSDFASNPSYSSTGPTNVCAFKHNGYIGTIGLLPGDGSGLRGFSCLATVFSAAAKLYIAKNKSPAADDNYVCCSSVESTQGVIIMRGQVILDGYESQIHIDLAQPVDGSKIYIPHTKPGVLPEKTFQSMYQNPNVFVTNAGIVDNSVTPPNPVALINDPQFTAVQAIVKDDLLIINSNPSGTSNIVVNYMITCERKDHSYINSGFVDKYTNVYTGSEVTWSADIKSSGLNNIFGTGSYNFS